MNIKLIAISLLFSPAAFSQEISAPPPVDLLLRPHNKVYEGMPSQGPHGLKECCYQINETYVIYSTNLLGEGYTFTKEKPNQQCAITKSKIRTKNILGLAVGVTRKKATKLLGIH